MNQFVQCNHLKPGDELITPKSQLNVIEHHAIYIGFDFSNTHWIIHNDSKIGVTLIKLDDFLTQSIQVSKIIRFEGSNAERKLMIQEALKKINKPYNLINYNCEHFTNEIRTGKVRSIQIEKAGFAILGIAILIAILRD